MTKRVRYIYLHDSKGNPYGILCYRDVINGPFGYAMCHENDKFTKSEARIKSFKRLEEFEAMNNYISEFSTFPHAIRHAIEALTNYKYWGRQYNKYFRRDKNYPR